MSKYEKLNKDQLIKHINELEKQLKSTKYGLYWDKSIEMENAADCLLKSIPILTKKSELSLTKGGINNLLIEGDNLQSLTILNMIRGLKGLVDVIYIDPPYNTGNKDFKYNDNFVEKDDGFYHSKWLNFMQTRLNLMRDILKDTGVIFISIDDNELYNLKILCDSIFGSNCFLGNIVQEKANAQNDAINIQKNHEYCLVYCKKRQFKMTGKKRKEIPLLANERKTKIECFKEENHFYYIGSSITTGGEGGILNARVNLGYTIYFNEKSGDFIGIDDYDHNLAATSNIEQDVYKDDNILLSKGYQKIRPPRKKGKLGAWTWSIQNFNTNRESIIIRKTKNGYSVKKKIFINADQIYKEKNKYFISNEYLSPLKSVVTYPSSNGSSELIDILGVQDFNNPKNVEYIKHLLNSFPDKNAVILDCFAGSGTTGQAVMELNKEDGGRRSFILCTNNENNICTDVTLPRLKTLITGTRPDTTQYGDAINTNIHYFKTEYIPNVSNSDQAKYNLVEKVNNLICISEDVYDLVESDQKYFIYQNSSTNKQVFMYIDYYEKHFFDEFKNKISNSQSANKVVYMFSTDNVIDEMLFKDLKDIEVKPIPSKIYEIYKEIVEDIKRG